MFLNCNNLPKLFFKYPIIYILLYRFVFYKYMINSYHLSVLCGFVSPNYSIFKGFYVVNLSDIFIIGLRDFSKYL